MRTTAAIDGLQMTLDLVGSEASKGIEAELVSALGFELQRVYTRFEETGNALLTAKGIIIEAAACDFRRLLAAMHKHVLTSLDERTKHFWNDLMRFTYLSVYKIRPRATDEQVIRKAECVIRLWPETREALEGELTGLAATTLRERAGRRSRRHRMPEIKLSLRERWKSREQSQSIYESTLVRRGYSCSGLLWQETTRKDTRNIDIYFGFIRKVCAN
ncbi:hypothetical protein BH18ACI4_BH18ACI4_26730 [soil metagenome]